MDPSVLVPLLSLFPESARAYVLSALVFLGSLTVVISAMKAIVAGLRDLALRTATTADDEAVSVLSDVVTLIADVAEWCKSLLEVIGAHRAPPLKAIASKLKRSPPVTALMIAVALLAPSYACAGSQVRTNAQIADALYEPILAAKQAIESRAYEQVGHIRAASLTVEEADSKIALLRERYRPVEGAMTLVIEGYNAYVDAIQKAHADGSDLRTEAAMALLNRWRSLMRAAGDLGIPLPEIPDALKELAP
jgi:uncharacterized iron-regulated protein